MLVQGRGGAADGCYLIRFGANGLVVWEWDGGTSRVEVDEREILNWQRENAPILVWPEKLKEHCLNKSVIELLDDAHARPDSSAYNVGTADRNICLIEFDIERGEDRFLLLVNDSELEIAEDRWHVVEVVGVEAGEICFTWSTERLSDRANPANLTYVWAPDGEGQNVRLISKWPPPK
jgi:hypothetical protein